MTEMRKLIEIEQPFLIECDNPQCDYKIPNITGDPHAETKQYINNPCPKCGNNLLIESDYFDHIELLKTIDWANKWFSWLTIFSKRKHSADVSIHVHDGFKITEN